MVHNTYSPPLLDSGPNWRRKKKNFAHVFSAGAGDVFLLDRELQLFCLFISGRHLAALVDLTDDLTFAELTIFD